ncbi:hypothetical protein, partial [Acinetobacter bereziniae]|uniref:hypothetical protein n=1 Tax=Acinetobacter bereziniae TaxID=106648 RepID=UPI002575B5AF
NLYPVPTTSHLTSHVTCFKCRDIGHKAYECTERKTDNKIIKRIWIPKGTLATNPKGPKKAWVPKTTT